MIRAGRIIGAYRNCIAETCNFLTKCGHAVNYSEPTAIHEGKDLVVGLSEPLYFRDWPYRRGSSKDRIDILADIYEKIRLSDGKCVHSTLRLNYFRFDAEKRIACDAIHYDFDTTTDKDQHPISHAQGANSILKELPDAFSQDVDTSPIQGRHQSIWIPCAFVNLAGLFAKLTADHLSAETSTEFWEECKEYVKAIPDHAPTGISEALFKAKTLRSYNWYRW